MQQLGPYQLIDLLATGGMAEIYRARAIGLQGFEKRYVLKLLHPRLMKDESFTRLLIEEAKLTARLNHCNIAHVHDLGHENDVMYIVMEYVDGRDMHETLARVVGSGQQFPIDVAVYIAKDACAGLHYAHTRRNDAGEPLKLVHRDVSLHNILLSYEGEVKIIDFGVAKVVSEAREETRAGIIKGKFGYMSPEQAWDKRLDGRSDIFAVGICLYEMLTGRSVYGQAEDPITMIRKIRKAEIAPPSKWRPEIPRRLEHILMKALERDVNARYANAHEFQQSLTAFLSQHSPAFTGYDAGVFLRDIFELPAPGVLNETTHDLTDETDIEGTRPDLPSLSTGNQERHTKIQPDPGKHTRPIVNAVAPPLSEGSLHAQAPMLVAPGEDLARQDFADERTELFKDDDWDSKAIASISRASRRNTSRDIEEEADPTLDKAVKHTVKIRDSQHAPRQPQLTPYAPPAAQQAQLSAHDLEAESGQVTSEMPLGRGTVPGLESGTLNKERWQDTLANSEPEPLAPPKTRPSSPLELWEWAWDHQAVSVAAIVMFVILSLLLLSYC